MTLKQLGCRFMRILFPVMQYKIKLAIYHTNTQEFSITTLQLQNLRTMLSALKIQKHEDAK